MLRAGGIVAYPTEAVFGLGCAPEHADSVSLLAVLKSRTARQGFILVAADLAQVNPLIEMPEGEMGKTIIDSWPGHVTWVFSARPTVSPWLVGAARTIAVRVTTHPLTKALCREYGGPIISTSANLRGAPPARTALQVRRRLPRGVVDYILSGRVGGYISPSEIRDARDGRVLRKG